MKTIFQYLQKKIIIISFFIISLFIFFPQAVKSSNTHIFIEGIPEATLNSPAGIAITRRGILYVVNTLRKKIMLFDSDGQLLTEFGEEGLSKGKLQIPWDIAIDRKNKIYVSDIGRHVILCFTPQGKFEFEFTASEEFLPVGLCWDRNCLYTIDAAGNKVYTFTAEGKAIYSFGKSGSKDGELLYPVDLAIYMGKIFVVDSGNFRIQVFDKEGNYLTKFGSAGSRDGEFSRPKSIEIDSKGNIFVSDVGTRKIQMFDKAMQYQFTIDKENKKNYFFQSPLKMVSFDQALFVTDSIKNRLIKFQKVTQYFGGCLGCHTAKRNEINRQNVHAPFFNNCEHCHLDHGQSKQLLLVEEGNEICLMCHSAMEENLSREHHYFPVNKLSCLGCHNPHASDGKRLLKAHNPVREKNCEACHTVEPATGKVTMIKNAPSLCYDCHESKQNKDIIHKPVADGKCLDCHDVHSKKYKGCLVVSEDALCEKCHKNLNRNVHQSHNPFPSVTKLSKKINRKIEAVAVNKKGQVLCINCHQPHCSESRKLLRERYVSCMGIGCHSDWP